MKKYALAIVIGALVLAAVVAAIGVARAGAMTTHHRDARAAGASAGCQRLMKNPAAMQVMHTLHADHVKDIQAWRDRYGSDPSSPEARQALDSLWREHRAEMKAAFAKAGVKLPANLCTRQMMRAAVTGNGGGMMGTDGGGMMGTDGAGMMGDESGSLHEQHHAGTTGETSGMMGGASGMMGGATY